MNKYYKLNKPKTQIHLHFIPRHKTNFSFSNKIYNISNFESYYSINKKIISKKDQIKIIIEILKYLDK